MSDLREEYLDLVEAYKKIYTQSDLQMKFEAQWHKVFAVAEGAKDKANADVTESAKEMEVLIQSLTEPFSKSYRTKDDVSYALKKPNSVLVRRTAKFCRNCGFKLNPAAVFCKNCGTKAERQEKTQE